MQNTPPAKSKLLKLNSRMFGDIYVSNSYNKIKQFYQNSFTMQSKSLFTFSQETSLLSLRLLYLHPNYLRLLKLNDIKRTTSRYWMMFIKPIGWSKAHISVSALSLSCSGECYKTLYTEVTVEPTYTYQ